MFSDRSSCVSEVLSPMARSFYVSRRKVASKVIRPELGLDLLYPDYESGLAAILKAEIEG